MSLPVFRSSRIRRNGASETSETPQPTTGAVASSEKSARSSPTRERSQAEDARAMRNLKRRRIAIIISCSMLLISVIMLLLVMIGNIKDKPVLRQIYLFKLDLANILPAGVSEVQFVNSIARSLGLHDFYQVGLWNFCEGYNDEGITHCSKPQNLYWFNPVAILLSELLSGATIALPSQITTILTLIRVASEIMFSFFLTSLCSCFVLLFISPLTLSPSPSPIHRFLNLFINILLSLNALLVFVASVIGTAMAVIFQKVITSQTDLNIGAELGIRMLVFMWIGTAGILGAWLIHLGMSCCCTGRRNGCCGIPCCGGSHKYGRAWDEDARVVEEKDAERRRRAAAGTVSMPSQSGNRSPVEGV
ncbi:SUR7/PalI family-domain-containing protein [Xylogone sp. PMI_703]|nr:SUR7/PalI family-domain-containing protein [Xylogone sp. PMI_703]